MPGLILHLFGYPRIERNDEPVHIERRKAVALLAYLAVTQQAHSRDTLAALLWPDLPQRQARTMLRSALVTLNRTFDKGWFTRFEDQLALPAQPGLWVDVNHFHSLLASVTSHRHPSDSLCDACIASLVEAADLCQGSFLAGFSLPDTSDFEIWQSTYGPPYGVSCRRCSSNWPPSMHTPDAASTSLPSTMRCAG